MAWDRKLGTPSPELAVTIQDLFRASCVFKCPQPIDINDTEAATQLYRIAQEAVNNAIKHGRSKNITISLNTQNNQVELTVQDDGCGFPKTQGKRSAGGMGVLGVAAGRRGRGDLRR